MRRSFVLAIAAALTLWIATVAASGLGWNPFDLDWDFSNTGSFGDSFGPLGAVMAGFAALAAFETLSEQRAEFARIANREREEDDRRKAADERDERIRRLRQAAEAKQLFEQTFFRLLGSLREIVQQIDVGSGDRRMLSYDAIQNIVTDLDLQNRHFKNLREAWKSTFEGYQNDLGHYFRSMYHLICFVDLQDSIDRYFYIRLVRASLSESEMVLLAINCAVGEGEEKFKPLVERYALLHNISARARTQWKLDLHFDASAFDYGEF